MRAGSFSKSKYISAKWLSIIRYLLVIAMVGLLGLNAMNDTIDAFLWYYTYWGMYLTLGSLYYSIKASIDKEKY